MIRSMLWLSIWKRVWNTAVKWKKNRKSRIKPNKSACSVSWEWEMMCVISLSKATSTCARRRELKNSSSGGSRGQNSWNTQKVGRKSEKDGSKTDRSSTRKSLSTSYSQDITWMTLNKWSKSWSGWSYNCRRNGMFRCNTPCTSWWAIVTRPIHTCKLTMNSGRGKIIISIWTMAQELILIEPNSTNMKKVARKLHRYKWQVLRVVRQPARTHLVVIKNNVPRIIDYNGATVL